MSKSESFTLGVLVSYKTELITLSNELLLKEFIKIVGTSVSKNPDDISNHKVAICSGEILKRMNGIDLRAS